MSTKVDNSTKVDSSTEAFCCCLEDLNDLKHIKKYLVTPGVRSWHDFCYPGAWGSSFGGDGFVACPTKNGQAKEI
jgi:hypothetical protein